MAPLVALFSGWGNTQLASGLIFRHGRVMLVWRSKDKTGPLFSSFLAFVVGFSFFAFGCDKAPSKKGPEKSAPHVAAAESPRKPESQNEPDHEGSETPAEGRQIEHIAAAEASASPVKFAEGSSQEFRAAFLEFEKWVKERKGTVHAALVDLETDKWLLRADAEAPVNPASNAKVLTAAAALELLGPAYTFQTELFGDIDASGGCERIVIKGGGAPDLTTADLYRLIRVAKGQGLSEVKEIVVDQTRFDENFTPPAFEQQPGEWAPFRAPVSALAVNENTVSLSVVPTVAGSPARLWYDPPGVVVPEGAVLTAEKSTGDRVSWSLDVKKDPARPSSLTGGTAGEGLGRLRYARRLEDPRLAGGYALGALLLEAGVKVSTKVTSGARKSEAKIALWSSAPLAEVVRALGKDSNNFVAEMLLIALSQVDDSKSKSEPWSSKRGAAELVEWLEGKKIDVSGLVLKNGSGLFDANKMSAELLTSVLAAMEDNPRVYQDFVSHLAMGATDGTMKQRMRSSELGQRIRAKTGTLKDVDALSGYVQRPGGLSPAAFSLIVVGVRAPHGEIRSRVDALVLKWAKML
jgi:D-alanyl-D-alanine carboxypeptidase/D-alanyl-D-alanine-endopeptidase (penicillin-binding protein 4)